MKNLSVFKYLSLLIKFFSTAARVAAKLWFLFISETLVILCCCSLSSYQNCLWVDILFSLWNISCEDLNIFPAAPINFLAIIWLKTLQEEKNSLIQWFTFTKSGTQEFSLVFFSFNEILVGGSLGTILVGSLFPLLLYSLLFIFPLVIFLDCFLVARTEWMWKTSSAVFKKICPNLKGFAVLSQVIFFFSVWLNMEICWFCV